MPHCGAVVVFGLGLSLLMSACGEGGAEDDDVELTNCLRMGDPEVSCRFEGTWSTDAQPQGAFVGVSAIRPGALDLALGRIGQRASYLVWAFRGATDTTFSGPVQVRFSRGDHPKDGDIEIALLDGGSRLRLHVNSGGQFLTDNSTFEGVFVDR